jgi:hypothetical protein
MKKFSILMLAFLAAFSIISCGDDEEALFVTQPSGDFSFRTTAATSYILTFETRANTAERFVWEPLEMTTPIALTYTLEASTDTSAFSNPVEVASTSDTSVALTVEEMNDLALQLGLTPFSQGEIAMRVFTTADDSNVESVVSDVITLFVTPYTTESPKLWVPGNYAAASGYGADWTPDDPETPFLEAVEFGSTQFEGFINMDVASPEFKFTTAQNFDNAFGDAGGGAISLSAGNNLTAPGPGYYFITVDTDPDGDPNTDDGTFTISERVWGIIGAATLPSNPAEWGDELDMTYDSVNHVWTIDAALTPADMKFRAQDWSPQTRNFGIDENGEPGDLRFDGPNIPNTVSGNARIILDLSQPRNYTYSITSI